MRDKFLSHLSIPEDEYKADIQVSDRYQAFSTELLRLSLLGIAGYGFLVSEVVFKAKAEAPNTSLTLLKQHPYWIVIGLSALGVSAALALGHKYFATDCITHHVRKLRLMKFGDSMTVNDLEVYRIRKRRNRRKIKRETRSFERDLNTCRLMLIFSTLLLVVGIVAVAVTFTLITFDSTTPVPGVAK
jgi:hypothetical protein